MYSLAKDNYSMWDHISPVCICTAGELFGGVERHVLGLLAGLRMVSIRTQLVVFHESELAKQARAQGDIPIVLPDSNGSLLIAARSFARTLANQRVRLVHVHGYKAAVFAALARTWHPFAIVETQHGMPEPMVGGILTTCRDRLYHRLDAIAMRFANAAICYVTRDLEKFRRHTYAKLQATVIPNGIVPMNVADFRRPREYPADRLNFAIVGRLDRIKGHRYAVEAMAADARLRGVNLQIIGTGPTAPELRALVDERDLSGQVHFLGFKRDVYSYIAHCDALIMPSMHEGLPYTLLESMALARPIIASRVGGIAEVLDDGMTGILTEPGNTEALASAFLRILENSRLRQTLGDQAQALQRSRYSLDAMISSYLSVYRERLAAFAERSQ